MQNDMRDRLVELIKQAKQNTKNANCDIERNMIFADYLIENCVVVLPCRVGDSIFRVGNGEIWEWLIEHIEIYEDEVVFIDDSENIFTEECIGDNVFLTKDQAEQKLKELRENG